MLCEIHCRLVPKGYDPKAPLAKYGLKDKV